ncbi:hypothetical protein B1F74_05275 [Pseudomonas syringae]|nr:hypothetical protein B1F74_05275 [Pseudomonas syringae]
MVTRRMNCWRTCASLSGSNREDAGRPERHANAEHWHDSPQRIGTIIHRKKEWPGITTWPFLFLRRVVRASPWRSWPARRRDTKSVPAALKRRS